jgi:DNA primase
VVFPFYYNDEIVRFQVRFINPKNSDKRYYTYPGSTIPYSPNRVWKRFSKSVHSITLCEGVFDAIALLIMGYPNPIAILGNNLTDYHIFLLRRLVPQKIILALDTGDLNYKIKKSLIKIPSVSESEEVLFNSKDPDEYLKNSSDNYSSNVINLMRS